MIEIIPVDEGFERWDDLLDLILSSFAYMNGVIDPSSSALALTPAALREKALKEPAFVAIGDDDGLAGCIFCKTEPPDCLYIGKLAVSPEAQGMGIGRRLLASAERLARDGGLKQLRLETRIELSGNHRTFEAWGFSTSAEGRHKGFDRTTFIEMRKKLS